MLVKLTAADRSQMDPITIALNDIGTRPGPISEELREGIYLIKMWNPEFIFFELNALDKKERESKIDWSEKWKIEDARRQALIDSYPEKYGKSIEGTEENDYRGYSEYGVCDSWQQLLEYYPHLEKSEDKYAVTLVRITKKDNQDENGSGYGGWRWHKWGPYIGTQKPQCEYIGDEPEIEEVFTYHIYLIEEAKVDVTV